MKLTLRKNGKYYQAGYREGNNWVNLEQLGTPEKILSLIRLGKYISTKLKTVPKFQENLFLNVSKLKEISTNSKNITK